MASEGLNGPRVQFLANREGTVSALLNKVPNGVQNYYNEQVEAMAEALWELEVCGAAPVLPDDRVGGNAAFRLPIEGHEDAMVVSKSGKLGGVGFDVSKDACVVTGFDHKEWSSTYYSISDDVLPTSDTPMHYAALTAHSAYGWTEKPNAFLHGHALESAEAAQLHGLPISHEITTCSTPDDTKALMLLLKDYAYPAHKVFIRRGHGFVVLGKDVADALNTLRTQVLPAMESEIESTQH
ncbi:hypothetical protein CAPTEDRAFT_186854 [Capitella teleta]|uniref:Class II aldolase/adducin N-terminal domain-containing protein n=1 Tax=Capitella teleta TaxID=283909 RepID=R7U539_CAPTE|nr:hypothetical protein CAPTEDRAFT_186854 [Capitella teleta]|eukprot:ELU01460.1 hypothetical protein CAPTEDRAFT_186854 [Capitella teleta]